MLFLLVKKQMMEIFRQYIFDEKKGKMRSKGAIVGMSIGFVAVFLLLGFIFGTFAWLLLGELHAFQLDWLFFTLFAIIAIVFGVIGSVFSTYSSLYLAKDNDILFSLPIQPAYIIFSRLIAVYIMSCLYTLSAWIPAQIVYLFFTSFNILTLLATCITGFCISLFVLVLASILGLIVAKVSLKLKNKSFVTVIISLVGIGAYMYFYTNISNIMNGLLENVLVYQQAIQTYAYPLYAIGQASVGNLLYVVIVLVVTLVLVVVTWMLLKNSFFGIASGSATTTRIKVKKAKNEVRSIQSALFHRELKHFTSSASYMLNCALSSVFMVAGAGFLLFKVQTILQFFDQYGIDITIFSGIIVICVCAMASMNDLTAPSISLEGKTLWLAQSLPVKSIDILNAKIKLHLAITLIPAWILSIICMYIVHFDIFTSIFLLVTPFLFIVLTALFGLFLNLLMPNLKWTNEMVPIKQSLPVFIGLMVPMGVAVGSIFLYLYASNYLMDTLQLLPAITNQILVVGYTIILGLLCGGFYLWLLKKGTKILENL